jgi:hypothetical protein
MIGPKGEDYTEKNEEGDEDPNFNRKINTSQLGRRRRNNKKMDWLKGPIIRTYWERDPMGLMGPLDKNEQKCKFVRVCGVCHWHLRASLRDDKI